MEKMKSLFKLIKTGNDYDILDLSDTRIAILGCGDGNITPYAYHAKELMSKNEVHLFFNWTSVPKSYFHRGCYVIIPGLPEGRFTLREDPIITYNENTGGYQYDLKFEALEMLWQDIVFFYVLQNMEEAEWKLTGTPKQFLDAAVAAVNGFNKNTYWSVGSYIEADPLLLEFNSENVFDGLTEIAEKFDAEWYVDYELKTINLVNRHEYGEVETLALFEELADIRRSNPNNEDYHTHLYAFGSTRNIPENYRGLTGVGVVDAIAPKRLRLPESTGGVIEAFPNLTPVQIIPKVKIFEDVYPKRIGTITSIRKETVTTDGVSMSVFYFKDSGFQFNKKYILPGLTLRADFQGAARLSGRGFDLAYHPDSQEFEIINNQDNVPLVIPNDTLCPEIGDEYVLYNFDISMVGDIYVPLAEQELEDEARKWQQAVIEDTSTYDCMLDCNNVFDNAELIRFNIGQRVRLESDMFTDGFKESRIYGYEKILYDISMCTFRVGDKPRYSRLASIENKVDTNKEHQEIQNQQTNHKINLNGILGSRMLQALKELIFDTDGYFDPTNIKPNSIETQYLAVGAKSRDFTTDGISVKAYKENEYYKINATIGYINHRSLWWGGGETMPLDPLRFRWRMNAELTRVLADNSSAYYVYVQASRVNNIASYHITPEQLKYDFNNEYYFLLLGVVYPVSNGRRDVSMLNGMAFINGGQIYGDILKSINYVDNESNLGSRYNLNDGSVRLGNKSAGLSWNQNGNNKLEIAGAIVQSPSGDTNVIGVFRGVYNDDNEYFVGDEVTYLGSTYRCISNTQTGGIPPTEETYWKVIAQKGTNGTNGADGTNGNYTSYVFKQSATEPTKPTGTNPLPSGWVDAPTSSGTWWMSKALVNGSTNQAGAWSAVVRVTGQNGANGADGGFIAFIYAKNTSLTVPPAIDKTVILPSGWSVEPVSLGVGEFMWMAQAPISANGELIDNWSDPVRISGEKGEKGADGEKGQDGENGKNGRIFSYRGDYLSTATYKGDLKFAEIVRYNNQFYYTKDNAGTVTNTIPTNTSKWEYYGASFESVATDLLFADHATIAGFDFFNTVIKSTKVDESGNPVLALDGINGNVQMSGSFIGKIQSSTQSTRIVIDPTPSAQEIQFYYENLKTGAIGINTRASEMRSAEFSTRGADSLGDQLFVRQNANGIFIYRNNVLMFRVGFDNLSGTLKLIASNLPTSAQSQPSGTIYRSGDTLKIVQ